MGILSQVAKRIKAYHGSPHDFDKFSTENIGTGEGAQAYGHGLYFAEREGTAEAYKTSGKTKGSMYEVNINASPEELLDFDLPIKNQPKNVQSAVYKSIETVPQSTLDNYFGGAKQNIISGDMTGRDFITNMEKATGNIDGGEYELAKRGIKGIKYADAQTRFSPKGRTNNFVIFDDKTIEIARKYGVSMPVAGAILAGTMTPEDAQASVPQAKDGLLKDTGDVLLETMAGVNRGVLDALNFVTTDQVNAVSQLMGSDKRVPNLYDVPLIEEATSGNFMDKGALRQAVRQGGEFLSPI